MQRQNSHANRRVRMTKRLFQEALMSLLEEKPIDQISVTELCARADLNRTTFYLHYGQPLDVLREMEDNCINDIRSYVQDIDSTTGLKQKVTRIMTYIKENQSRFILLVQKNGRDEFRRVFMTNIVFCLLEEQTPDPVTLREQQNSDAFKSEATYRLSFMTSGAFAVIYHWATLGYPNDPEEIATYTLNYCNAIWNLG